MNISAIDAAPPEGKGSSVKTDTEGTDLFSILMASIAAGGGTQQVSDNVAADGGASIPIEQLTSIQIEGAIATQDKGLVPGMQVIPQSYVTTRQVAGRGAEPDIAVTEMTAGYMVPLHDGNGYAGDGASILTALNRKVSDSTVIPDTGVKAQLSNPDQAVDGLKQIVEGELGKDSAQITLHRITEEVVAGEKGMDLTLLGVAKPPERGFAGDSKLMPEQGKKEEPVDIANSKLLLPQAVKGVKEGSGIEVKQADVKTGTAVFLKDGVAAAKESSDRASVTTSFGQESNDYRLLHVSERSLAESDPAIRNIQRVQIAPADLIAQVSGRIKTDIKGEGGEIRMELHPESLGQLKIEIKVEGGVVRANILTENAMVRDTIDSNISILKSSLEDHGLRIDQLSVGVDQRQGDSAFAEKNHLQRWQGLEDKDPSLYTGKEVVNESWYRADSLQGYGVSIFA